MNKQHYVKPFTRLIVTLGAIVCLFSAYNLPVSRLDGRLLLLAFFTVVFASRLTIQIPRAKVHSTVSDSFVFLTLLLYGAEPAVLLATVEAFYTSLRFRKRGITIRADGILFNSALMACSTFLTSRALSFCFGPVVDLPGGLSSSNFIIALCFMAFVQYLTNSSLAAVYTACDTGEPVWSTWSTHYFYISVTYFAGAMAAGVLVKLIGEVGFYAIFVTTPIIVLIYFTHRRYIDDIKASAAQAERAEHARAEAERERAEQAERHIEELNHYIAEQERIREQFSQVEKLSALGELASGVAHNFNNTLAAILGRAQLLLRNQDLPEKAAQGLELIANTAADGAKTVKRIQDFARQRRDQDFEPIAVDHLLWEVGEITRPRWKDRAEAANVHISLALEIGSKALIMGDAGELREVLVNMVFNAVDAMPEGGRLTLATREVNGRVEISVSDTGHGMSEEVRSRIFNPFFTTKGKAGMGLGLAVSYGIIRRHEGTVRVESAVGEGATFRISLPITTGVRSQAKAEPVKQVGVAERSEEVKVLIVEDEKYVCDVLLDILEAEGIKTSFAESGPRALELFGATHYDAVFTDVGLPGMSGWELARHLRALDGSLPIAIITGWGDAVSSAERETAEVNWVVTKPFTLDRIVELAREVTQSRAQALRKEDVTLVDHDSTVLGLVN